MIGDSINKDTIYCSCTVENSNRMRLYTCRIAYKFLISRDACADAYVQYAACKWLEVQHGKIINDSNVRIVSARLFKNDSPEKTTHLICYLLLQTHDLFCLAFSFI